MAMIARNQTGCAHDRMIVADLTSVSVLHRVRGILNSETLHEAMHHRMGARSRLDKQAGDSLILVASAVAITTRQPNASGEGTSRERTTTVLDHPLALGSRETGGPVSYEWRADVGAWSVRLGGTVYG